MHRMALRRGTVAGPSVRQVFMWLSNLPCLLGVTQQFGAMGSWWTAWIRACCQRKCTTQYLQRAVTAGLQGHCSDECGSGFWRNAQMVDRMDQGLLPAQVVPNTYDALWRLVSKALYRTHVEGKLKVCAAAT